MPGLPSVRFPLGYLLFLCGVATLAGFLFGFDSAVINGTVTALSAAFGTSAAATGLAVSSVLFGSVAGSLLAGRYADRFGRKPVMLATALLFAVSAWGSGAAGSAATFILYRLIGGLGVGAACVVAPAYIAEISPAALRGRFTTIQQLAIVAGLQCAFLSNFFIARAAGQAGHAWLLGVPAWRWMFWVQLLPSAGYLLASLLLPESPRYLVARGREDEARGVMRRLWGDSADPEAMLSEIRATVDQQARPHFRDVCVPGTRRLLPIVWVAVGLGFFQQASGINAVFYFGEYLWRAAGFTEQHALLINITLGAVLIGATLVSMTLVDRVGRRPLLLAGGGAMAVMLGVLATVFLLSARGANGALAMSSVQATATLVAEHIYIFCFGASWGPVIWVLYGEMFPNRIRGSAIAVAAGTLWVTNCAVTTTFPILLKLLGLGGVFCIYASAALASLWTVQRYLPETKGRTLEVM